MYNSHPSEGAYGNPGFFVANPSGKVRDSSGRLVDLRPDDSERYARRILVRTSELHKTHDGVYVAKIRRAKNVTAIKLGYASIPRSVSRVTAQLILYSIAIKRNVNDDYQKVALQRMCRSQLLSPNTSDVPFFRVSRNDFDWRNGNSMSAWINSFDRNTFIPPQLESEVSNQYVDIDVLTVKVPSMCSLHNLGMAFANALKSHSGAENTRNNSIWTKFDISVEETGFSVLENINDSDVFTTFASMASPYVTPDDNDTSLIRQNQSAVNAFLPMGTPLTIRMKKSKSVFVSTDTLIGASTSPAYISPSIASMTEFSPTVSSGGSDTSMFETVIDTPNRYVYSFSCFGDMSADDILEVEYKQVRELHVTSLPTATSPITNPTFRVKYYYGAHITSTTATIPIFLRTDGNTTVEFLCSTFGTTDDGSTTITIDGTFDPHTGALTKTVIAGTAPSEIVRVGSSFFHLDTSASKTVDVSEVKRTYQKTRDVKLGLRWGNNKEGEDFFIDSNHSLDSPMITNDPIIQNMNPNYDFVEQHRRDVALLSQYSKRIRATQTTGIDDNNILTLSALTPANATIIEGMLVTASAIDSSEAVTVSRVSNNQVTLSKQITIAVIVVVVPSGVSAGGSVDFTDTNGNPQQAVVPNGLVAGDNFEVTVDVQGQVHNFPMVFTFQVSPVNNSTYHNMLRNTGDLEDTYIKQTTTSSEIFNVHQVNDAHQIQRMLFSGHMMNVAEPTAMPVSNQSHPAHGTGQRPPLDLVPGSTTPAATSDFYQNGLGWQTSIVHAPTRFIMPAFPCRFTELDDSSNSGNPPSIYNTTSVSVETSVSPLVSRILNPTSVVPPTTPGNTTPPPENVGYYQLNKVDDSETVDTDFLEANGSTDSSSKIDGLSYYTPRSDNTCGIVVTIGNENYVVKKARLISVLKNETLYTLNLTCDRNYNSSPVALSSIKNLELIRTSLRNQGYKTEKERVDLQSRLQHLETEIQNAFHSFYYTTTLGYQVDANAKYFSWVYELDRPVQLPTGISPQYDIPYRPGDASMNNPPVAERTFNGIVDIAALFTPGIYERNTGRSAVTSIQECAHSFSVRSGSQESENSLLVLHGIGSLERPLNSTHSTDAGDVFAVMGAENDLKKPEKMVCDTTAFLRSPDNLDSLIFHFINSRTGEMVDIGNQNATLIFDIYCSNE